MAAPPVPRAMQAAGAPSRRLVLGLAAVLPLTALLSFGQAPAPAAPPEPLFVDPPGPLPESLKPRLEATRAALAGGQRTVGEVLREPSSNELRPYTEFRDLIREQAREVAVRLAPSDEPGEPLLVRLRVVDGEQRARAGVLVYAYQTSAKGWYAAAAPHVGGNEGDHKHARLFGYCRTGPDGWVELDTIRPGGYPRSTLPQHIHVALTGEPGRPAGAKCCSTTTRA